MDGILTDLSTPNLIQAIEDNLSSFMPSLTKWPRAAYYEDPEVIWVMTDVPSPMFNSVLCAKLPSEKIDPVIGSIIDQAKSRSVPFLWWIGPATEPADLGDHLEKHGFVTAGNSPGMALELNGLQDDLPTPAGLTVQLVDNHESQTQWCQVLGTCFELSNSAVEAYDDMMNYLDPDKTLVYLGLLDNEPVATAMLYLGAGVAGIYGIATLPEARRKGIGSFMTVMPLLAAKDRGYKIGILHSSEEGFGVYCSVGFQEYCKIEHYFWSPENDSTAA